MSYFKESHTTIIKFNLIFKKYGKNGLNKRKIQFEKLSFIVAILFVF